MPRFRLHHWSKTGSRAWDKIRVAIRLGRHLPVTIQAYRGFGSHDYLFMSGRVLRDKSIRKDARDTTWRNFINTVKRFNSREINDARLRIHFAGETFELETDAEGYYTLDTHLSTPLPPAPLEPPFWQQAIVELLSIPGNQDVYHKTNTEVLIPGAVASFGVISDIDDTILKTYVTSWLKWRTLYLTILKNAFSRQAFNNVAPFYQALRRGPAGQDYNPFFYVSNSPWNLYDLMEEFLDLNQLPRGPIMLRDFGLPYEDRPDNYRGHKHKQILRILSLYPDLAFVLIGDSGEKDVDIYRAVAEEYPGRIKAIYIRDVRSRQRAERVQKVLDSIPYIPCLLVKSYAEATEHAVANGLLSLDTYNDFR
ncbi:MAG: phosphatase domain-containing protein [Bacteroidota bacterium]